MNDCDWCGKDVLDTSIDGWHVTISEDIMKKNNRKEELYLCNGCLEKFWNLNKKKPVPKPVESSL